MADDAKSDSPNPAQSSSAANEIHALRHEVSKLRTEIHGKRKEEPASRAKKWEVWLTIITALVALPRGAYDLYHFLWNEPATEISRGDSLRMSYFPAKQLVKFAFDLSADNVGSADDSLEVTGNLINEGDQSSGSLPFSSIDLECRSQATKLSLPLIVRINTPISASCNLSSDLIASNPVPFKQPGFYRLSLFFAGAHQKTHPVSFCFYMTPILIKEVFRSNKPEERRFLFPTCDQPGNGEGD
jgi:hypothetical protein